MKTLIVCIAIVFTTLPFVLSRPGRVVPEENAPCKFKSVNKTLSFMYSHADNDH